jgi:hypothetical protein
MTISIRTIFLAVVVGLALAVSAFAQQQEDEGTRRIWDSEFLKKRAAAKPPPTNTATTPPTAASSGGSGGSGKFPGYRRATAKAATPAKASDKAEVKNPSASVAAVKEEKPEGELLGVTIWRLRSSRENDDREGRILLEEEGTGKAAEWTPERVEADTIFAAGQRLRLSIESPRNGYLYVIDRELYADGSMSEPYLVFPTLRNNNGNNQVAAGKVIEIPGKTVFRLTASRPDYKGELLMLLVTSEPLKEVVVKSGISKLDSQLVAQWEKDWSAPVERFEMIGGAGKTRTKAENEAGQEGKRLLTQEDDLPQTLYRVAVKPGNPFLGIVTLKVGN